MISWAPTVSRRPWPRAPRSDVDSVLVHVENTVRAFRGETELSDDATIMALRFGHNEMGAGLV